MVSSTDSQNSSDPTNIPTGTQIHVVPQNFVDLIEATAYDVIMKPRERQQKSKDYKILIAKIEPFVGTYGRLPCIDAILKLITSLTSDEMPLSKWKEHHWEGFYARLFEVKVKLCRNDAIDHVVVQNSSNRKDRQDQTENEAISSLDMFTTSYDDLYLMCMLQQTMTYIRQAIRHDYEEETAVNGVIVEFIKETFREYNHCEKFLLSFFEPFETHVKFKPVEQMDELIRSHKEFSLERFKKDAERLLQNWYMKVIPTPAFVSIGIIPAVQVHGSQEINVDTIQNQTPRTPERKEARLMDERSPVKRNHGYNQSHICKETQQSESGCDLVVENTEQNSENESKGDDKETISSQENARSNQLSEESISNQVMPESRDQDFEMKGGSDGARDNGCDLVVNHVEQNSENESLVDGKENILSQENARPNHLSEYTISNQILSESRGQGVATEGGKHGEDEHQPESDYDLVENPAEKNSQAESKDDDKENASSSQEKTHVSEDTISFQSITESSDQGVEMERESHGDDGHQQEGGCELVTKHTEQNSGNESKNDDKEYTTNQVIPESRGQDVGMEGVSRVEDEHQQKSGGIDQNIDNDLRSNDMLKSKRKGKNEKRKASSSRYYSDSDEGSTNTSQEYSRKVRKRRAKLTGTDVKILPRRKRVKTNFYKPEIQEPRSHPKGNYKETPSSQESSQSIGNDTSYNESSSASMIRIDRVVHRNKEKDAEIPQNLRGKVCLSVEQEPLTMETFPAEEADTTNAPHPSPSTRPNQAAKRNPPSAHESPDQNDDDDSLIRSGGPMLSAVPSRAIVPAPSREVVRRHPRTRRFFSQEEKDTIKEAVRKWGLGKWVKIEKAYGHILVGRSNVDIKDCHRTMKRRGEI